MARLGDLIDRGMGGDVLVVKATGGCGTLGGKDNKATWALANGTRGHILAGKCDDVIKATWPLANGKRGDILAGKTTKPRGQ
jgi:hypothetical protein